MNVEVPRGHLDARHVIVGPLLGGGHLLVEMNVTGTLDKLLGRFGKVVSWTSLGGQLVGFHLVHTGGEDDLSLGRRNTDRASFAQARTVGTSRGYHDASMYGTVGLLDLWMNV